MPSTIACSLKIRARCTTAPIRSVACGLGSARNDLSAHQAEQRGLLLEIGDQRPCQLSLRLVADAYLHLHQPAPLPQCVLVVAQGPLNEDSRDAGVGVGERVVGSGRALEGAARPAVRLRNVAFVEG